MSNTNPDYTPVVLITGAAKRIGKTIAQHFHQQGFNVIVHCNASKKAAELLVNQLNNKRSNSAIALSADLNIHEEITQLAKQAIGWQNRIDVLVNNASTYFPQDLADTTLANWDNLFNSNAKAPYFLTQALLPKLQENQGSVVNIIDCNLERPKPHYSAYQMAKAALAMMTKVLAKELSPEVRVNGVAPGAIIWAEHEKGKQAEQVLKAIPLERTGEPEDIAEAVYFLTQAGYITGQILNVDGGKSI